MSIAAIIQTRYKNEAFFTTQELIRLLQDQEHLRNANTIKWRIHDLKENGIIHQVARGRYTLAQNKQEYKPVISRDERKIYRLVSKTFPYTKCCILNTGWCNEFMIHQLFATYLIVQSEKESVSAIFNQLSQQFRDVFIQPDKQTIDTYITQRKEVIIIEPLVSESPLTEVKGMKVPSLEKRLVDLWTDKWIYAGQQEEIERIFKESFSKYAVNLSRLKRYARRRNKEHEIMEFIKVQQIE